MQPIPITGVSAINALGRTRIEIVDALRAGRTGLAPNTIAVPFETVTGAVKEALPRLEGELSAYETRLSQILSYLVRELEPEIDRMKSRWAKERIGIFLGTSTAGAGTTEDAFAQYLKTGALPGGYDYEKQHTFGISVEVVRMLTGIEGPGWVVSTACTSSAKVAGSAARMIELGIIDAAVVGGMDTLCAMTLSGFWSLGALANTYCRPFSAESVGINIGEGGGLFLLERTGDPLALLEGVGESSDAYHVSAPHPEGLGARLAMERALPAGVTPAEVDHINAHGTGTVHNDTMESRAIREMFGDAVPVISTKGYTGHTLGGAGVTELALAVYMMSDGFIAPSVGTAPEHPELGIDMVLETRSAQLKRVLSNSFAFGGNNISLCLGAP